MPAGLRAENLTWPEIESALKRLPTIVIPVGAACKEHGLHLPMNTDLLTADYLARRVMEVCPVLVLPTVAYGYYPAFVEYPGSISISENTFRDTILDICRSFARHGARRFYVLNTGISTIPPLKAAREILAAENISMESSDSHSPSESARKSVEQQPLGTHADEIETSIMLYIAPQVVKLGLAVPELSADQRGGLTRDPAGKGVHSKTGAWGDPTLATREKGKIVVEAMIDDIVRHLSPSPREGRGLG